MIIIGGLQYGESNRGCKLGFSTRVVGIGDNKGEALGEVMGGSTGWQ